MGARVPGGQLPPVLDSAQRKEPHLCQSRSRGVT
uniref:Uncharacterized protein n=1 Tax=Arundo donax TaxID=35708 RepID=A0A0A9EJP8_ARUDO